MEMNKPARKPSTRIRHLEKQAKEAVREALLDHQRAGNPVAIWRDGKVVIVPPSKIPELISPNVPAQPMNDA